jgi:hypothetical protein
MAGPSSPHVAGSPLALAFRERPNAASADPSLTVGVLIVGVSRF